MPNAIVRSARHVSSQLGSAALIGLAAAALPAHASGPWAPVPFDPIAAPAPEREGAPSPYILEPIADSAIGIHVNMPVIRGANNGWERFAVIVETARAGGYYLMLNNMDGPRGDHHIAATFDNWSHAEIFQFASILAGSGVPILMYVGPVEDEHVYFAVGPDRLTSWRDDVVWLRQITGAQAGLIIDAASFQFPGNSPDGMSFYQYYSLYAQAMAVFNIEVGFEAWGVQGSQPPPEDRRRYALLRYIRAHYETLPDSADFDARIMSAIDRLPAANVPRCNTVWLDGGTWEELADGDHVPAEWLDAWGVTPEHLQAAVAARLWAKGYGLIFTPSVFGL